MPVARRDAGLDGVLSLDERVAVARRIAAATVFGGASSLWIGAEVDAGVEEDALARLGLSDDSAAKDMAELRELLSAWRDAKTTVRKAVLGWLVRGALALLLVGLAVRLGLSELIAR